MDERGFKVTYTGEEVQELLDKAGTAVQTETDPTVPSWAKSSSKPSYNYSEISNTPTLATVATSGDYDDLTNKPTIPDAQIQSDWNQSNTSAKDYIKNKPTIPVVPSNVSAFTNDAGYITAETDPTVPSWAKQTSKPSYAVGEISGAQETLVSGANIKTINGNSVLGSGNISIQGGDANVIESITFNGGSVPVSNKNAAITYTAPVTSVNGNTGAVVISVPTKVSDLTNDSGYITSYTETDPVFSASVAASITSADITAWNGKSDFSGSYNDLTDKPTIPTVPTTLSSFTDDLGSSPTHTHSQYLTAHQDISGKENTSNKVTSLSSSSTDTQYPSAKCVYDLIGDIETILASI